MPSKYDKIKLPREYDLRVKLTDADKEDMKMLHEAGIAVRAIARKYEGKCSRRMIQFILFPERLEAARLNRDWRKYADRAELTLAVRNIRARKKKLLEWGILKVEEADEPNQTNK